MQQQWFIDKSNLARHVSGNNFAHHQELLTVNYNLLYVVPNTSPVCDLVTEEFHYQIGNRTRDLPVFSVVS